MYIKLTRRVLTALGILLVIKSCSFLISLIIVTSEELAHVNINHQQLFPDNLTLINITNFSFILNNDICNISPLTIIIIVHSSTKNKYARDVIR